MSVSFLTRLRLRLRDLGPAHPGPPMPGSVVWAMNLGGDDVHIQGQHWWGQAKAEAHGLQSPGAKPVRVPVLPKPHAGPAWRQMLGSALCQPQTLRLSVPVPEGPHGVVLWLAENWQSRWHSLSLSIDGQPVAHGLGDLPLGGWESCGPYPINGPARRIELRLDTGKPTVDAHLMGLSLLRL
ncbi:MAG: hypothetical protein LW854_16270 [Rubrivivax sp.]|nr:hypothetical protein [Rubrivivax sp.]